MLFGIGLLGASLLAAAILPTTAAYVISETFGFEKGISRNPKEAPVLVGTITVLIAIGAIVAAIPGLPVISLLVGRRAAADPARRVHGGRHVDGLDPAARHHVRVRRLRMGQST